MAVKRFVFILFQYGKRGFIKREVVPVIQRQLEIIDSTKEDTEIDLLLDSPGGDPHSTYKIWLELRKRANKLRAWVPDYAKSAATLLLLGVDEIYMGLGAELGPLDVQISHPDRENITVSALDVVNSLDYFSKFSIELALTAGAVMIDITKLARIDVLKEILPFAAQMVRPCVEKIDPHLTQRASSQLLVAEHYAERMLKSRNLNGTDLNNSVGTDIAKRLVHEYPMHGCVIGRDEAKELGLPIYSAEKHPDWKIVKAIYDNYMANDKSVISVVSYESLTVAPKNKTKKKKIKKKTKKKKKKKAK
jgi:hypothetical protein